MFVEQICLFDQNIILVTRQRLSTCKCPYGQNVEFILLAINKRISMQLEAEEIEKLKLHSVHEALDVVMCAKSSQFRSMGCIDLECESCSDTNQ